MSLVSGLRSGIRSALRSGLNPSDSAITWPVDSASSKGAPLSAADWVDVRASAGVGAGDVSHTHGYQEASGDPQDEVSTLDMTIGGASHTYQQAVTGWDRDAFALTQAVGQYAGVTAGAPDLATESALYFGYLELPSTPSGNRDVLSASPTLYFRVTTGDKIQMTVNGIAVSTTNNHVGIGAFPYVLAWNRTLEIVKLYTHLEKLAGTYDGSGVTGNDYIIGAYVGAASGVAYHLLDAIFKGAPAELGAASEAAFDAAVSALLTTLGWAVGW